MIVILSARSNAVPDSSFAHISKIAHILERAAKKAAARVTEDGCLT
ncbi:hypothetical protein [uncultured Roseobacter sp.]|nr:hypothetical protein [uncultured Roseobacter sp.]